MTAGREGIQNHLTLTFPMKSAADAAALASELPPMMAEMFEGLDALGTIHYSRFAGLSEKTFLFLADYDGKRDDLLRGLAEHAGPVFDTVLKHAEAPPPTPVKDNADAFVKWGTDHDADPMAVYTAYPKASVQDIKSQALAAGVTGNSQQLPFLVIMPLKGLVGTLGLNLLFKTAGFKLVEGSDTIGTLHLAHFVPLEDNKLGFFTVYDGPFDKYIQDFAEKLGPLFDLLFKFVKDPPSTPSAKNADELTRWVAARDLPPIGFYQGYPGLQVQDVNALMADA